jgi:hypothetical protein
MLPIDFPERNFVFGKPKEMTDEQCMSLPVWKGDTLIDDAGKVYPCIISCWKLSKEDLDEIHRTGKIWLSINAEGMPPFMLFTEDPFEAARKYNKKARFRSG